MDNRYALLFIRGALPVMDLKTDLTKHRNIHYSSDGGGKPYVHHQPIYTGKPLFISVEPNNEEGV